MMRPKTDGAPVLPVREKEMRGGGERTTRNAKMAFQHTKANHPRDKERADPERKRKGFEGMPHSKGGETAADCHERRKPKNSMWKRI